MCNDKEEPTPNPAREGSKSTAKRRKSEYEATSPHKPPKAPLLGGAGGGFSPQRRTRRKIIPYNPKLKPIAKKLRKNMTLSEAMLWNHLKQKQVLGFDFDRQRPIDEFIVDFYCKDLMLAIEVDGASHETEEAQRADKRRQKRLESLGVHFLRFDDTEVKDNMEGVIDFIACWIRKHRL